MFSEDFTALRTRLCQTPGVILKEPNHIHVRTLGIVRSQTPEEASLRMEPLIGALWIEPCLKGVRPESLIPSCGQYVTAPNKNCPNPKGSILRLGSLSDSVLYELISHVVELK
jgi:hypothetical protein